MCCAVLNVTGLGKIRAFAEACISFPGNAFRSEYADRILTFRRKDRVFDLQNWLGWAKSKLTAATRKDDLLRTTGLSERDQADGIPAMKRIEDCGTHQNRRRTGCR